MLLILIGLNNSVLASLIPSCDGVSTILLSPSVEMLNPEKDHHKTQEGIVIIDPENHNLQAEDLYKSAIAQFPNFQIWAYYGNASDTMKQKLYELGYTKVFSSTDNPPESICKFFAATLNS